MTHPNDELEKAADDFSFTGGIKVNKHGQTVACFSQAKRKAFLAGAAFERARLITHMRADQKTYKKHSLMWAAYDVLIKWMGKGAPEG